LLQTLRNPQYFPHLEPNESLKLIVTELYRTVKNNARESITPFIENTDLSVLNKVPDSSTFPSSFHRDTLSSFMDYMLKIKEVRSNFISTYNIFTYNILERYITEIFQRRDFIYNELVRVQKTYLESDEYIVYLKALLLMRGIVYIKVPLNDANPEHKFNLSEIAKMPGKMPQYLTMLCREIKSTLPTMTDKSVQLSVKSNLSNSFTSVDEGSARLLYILCARFYNFKPVGKVDRGAESPDKSWFSIARKNARVFGFEKNMLEELYRISGDNNW